MSKNADQVRAAVRNLLERFARSPGALLREKDFQAALWSEVTGLVDAAGPELAVQVVSPKGKSPHSYNGLVTGRTHVEIEIVEWQPKGKDRLDLVVLRDDVIPQLTCQDFGPTDFWQRLRGADLAVAVELKASPSTYPTAPASYATDLRKLGNLVEDFPDVTAIFVLFDKALSLPAARGAARPPRWEQSAGIQLVGSLDGREGPVVEVWDLAHGDPVSVRQSYWRPVTVPGKAKRSTSKEANSALGPARPDGEDFGSPATTVRILDSLARFTMYDKLFRRIHHARKYENTIQAHRQYSLGHGGRFQLGGTNEKTARRLHECLACLEAGQSWDAAIAQANRRFPV